MPLKSHSPKLNFKTKKIDLIFLMTNWINDQTLQVYKEHKVKTTLLSDSCLTVFFNLRFPFSPFPSGSNANDYPYLVEPFCPLCVWKMDLKKNTKPSNKKINTNTKHFLVNHVQSFIIQVSLGISL